jgi:hypothetical protein
LTLFLQKKLNGFPFPTSPSVILALARRSLRGKSAPTDAGYSVRVRSGGQSRSTNWAAKPPKIENIFWSIEMKRKTTVLIITLITAFLILSVTALAAVGDKPETHDTGWLLRHGKVSAIDESECLSCHTDRLDCIRCHEDTKPRDHTSAYVNRGHTQKAMWSRNTCAACPSL